MQTSSQQKRKLRVRWKRVAETAVLVVALFYVFGYLCWQFWAFIFSPAAAWVISVLGCVGLPAAFVWGKSRRMPCRGCRELESTVCLLEERLVDLLRERDHLRARIHDSLLKTTCGKSG
jgi:hypothetical protein